MAELHIGFDRASSGGPITLDSSTLLRHAMALGSSGSGKTVFCKAVTEEILRAGVPAICIDPQGDLCSLALRLDDAEFLREKGIDPAVALELQQRIDPVIFTPASRKGVALSADPVSGDVGDLPSGERVYAITGMATMIVSLLGYDLDSDDGAGLTAVFDKALTSLNKRGHFPRTLDDFTRWLVNLDDASKEEFTRYVDARKLDQACQKLARLDVGARRLLFHEGLSLDIDLLLGRGDRAAAVPGKTRLSVIYLNTLNSQEDKEFFVAALTERLYSWMLRNPSSEPQALFYIDEVAPFIPPVRKPACKPALSLMFKQARKYGVSCLMATQNPADVDYKAMAQFGTWALGRMTTRQDMAKVQPTVKSLDPVNVDAIMTELPALKPGQFILISPDNFDSTRRLQTRWLLTPHETLDDERIEQVVNERCRDRFDALEATLKATEAVDMADDAEVIIDAAEALPGDFEPVEDEDEEDDDDGLDVTDRETSVDPELEKLDKILARGASMSAREFGAKARVTEGAARSRLRKLEAAGLARCWKDGRVVRYWSLASGLRPDLGLDRKVSALLARVSLNDVERKARDLRGRSALFGLIGEDEELDKTVVEYRLVMQVGFTEKVTRMFLKRIFGPTHDELVDFVYLHPVSLKIVRYDVERGIALEEKPNDYASRIHDFDGLATFEETEPAKLPIREADLRTRQSDEAIKASFKRRFQATPKRIHPVFLPVWNLHFRSKNRSAARVVSIDGLTGNPLEW
jgi:hypothetical protein